MLIGPVIAVLTISSLLSLFAMVRLATKVTQITDHHLPLVQYLTALTLNHREQALEIGRVVTGRPAAGEGRAEVPLESFTRRAERFRADLAEARRLVELSKNVTVTRLRPQMQDMSERLERIHSLHQTFVRESEPILRGFEAPGNAKELAVDSAEIASEALEKEVVAALLTSEELVAARAMRARREERRAIFWIGMLLVVAAGASVLIGVWGVRSLVAAKERERRFSALAAVGEFAANIAHGLRNPLAGMRAAAQFAAREQAAEGASGESIRGILKEADRLEQRIGSLLELARPYVPTRRRQDLREVIDAACNHLRETMQNAGIELVVDLPTDEMVRSVDGDFLEDAILELASNAMRAMPDGGTLEISLRRRGRGVRIAVTDTGEGVPEPLRDQVFDLFFTTRPDGSGIGLVGVRKIVEAHGGNVEIIESGPGRTVFAIDLP